eukprot:6138010-Ditylum_brightwellii.AAC.1
MSNSYLATYKPLRWMSITEYWPLTLEQLRLTPTAWLLTGTDLTTALTLFCDNSAAVTQTNLDISPGIRSHLAADYEIYSTITKLQTEGPKVTAAWVKAHQDSTKCTDQLTLGAQLNVQTDTSVTTFRKSLPTHLTPSSKSALLQSCPASLVIAGIHDTANIQQLIQDHSTSSNTSRYIMQRTGLTLQHMDEIDWDNLGKALEAQKLNTQIQIIKFMHNWLNTGTQKQKFYKDTVMSCPVCCSETETWQHMFHCKHEDSIAICTLALMKFKFALIKMNTAPILCQ